MRPHETDEIPPPNGRLVVHVVYRQAFFSINRVVDRRRADPRRVATLLAVTGHRRSGHGMRLSICARKAD
jgi:hypothetical protein